MAFDICQHCDGTGERCFLSGAKCYECNGTGVWEDDEEEPEDSDLLNMAFINSIPQPFVGVFIGAGDHWPVEDIDVQTGLLRIDVCGKLQAKHISDVRHFIDANGGIHTPDSFYAED